MYTRAAFEQQRETAKAVERRGDPWLAALSIGLGLAQMAFLRWADTHLAMSLKLAIAGTAFLVYVAMVAGLLRQRARRRRAARPRCPNCGASLDELSMRIAVASDRCDACGGRVISPS